MHTVMQHTSTCAVGFRTLVLVALVTTPAPGLEETAQAEVSRQVSECDCAGGRAAAEASLSPATSGCALGAGSLEDAQAAAMRAAAEAREAVARAEAAQQRVRDLGGAGLAGRPFWFVDLFPDEGRDEKYQNDPFIAGPTQVDDLGLLYATIKETRPRTVVEIGFRAGDGSRALLSAVDASATVHSFDPFPQAGAAAKLSAEASRLGRHFVFHQKRGEELSSADLGGATIDFAFIDPAHIENQSQTIFDNMLPHLAANAIVAVHDTGVWGKAYIDEHKDESKVREWLSIVFNATNSCDGPRSEAHASQMKLAVTPRGQGDEQYYIHPTLQGERKFVNWVKKNYPEWGVINFHTLNIVRNGVTLMQRQRALDVY
mmetsp:Transcript_22929/g.64021  ORF Transcript_22929/g.64021 Transcript_22929/m.64021 type:complete len:373 (+) Transcript_22929:49-1167(+)